MQPAFLRRIGRLVVVPALIGSGAAVISCAIMFHFWNQKAKTVLEQAEDSRILAERAGQRLHPPPVPVSPPLVRAQNSSPLSSGASSPASPVAPVSVPLASSSDSSSLSLTGGQSSASNVVPLADLPSFAPLVRQVIPAVVNISISKYRKPIRRAAPPPVANPDNGVVETPQEDTGSPTRHVPHHIKRGTSAPPRDDSGHEKKKHHRHKTRHHNMAANKVVRPVDDENSGAGSGFIVDSSGVIVTNRHVISGGGQVMVSLSDGRLLPARILGDDPMTDIAVIKVDTATALPCVTWGDSRLVEIGDWILVAGNPFGFGSSVTAGIVSAVGRDLGIGALDDFMQLDAPINPGNSGGPSFSLRGQVVAVNAAIASPSDGSVGIGFGIPAEIVAPIVAEIEKTGHVEHGWLGVGFNDATSPMWVEEVDRNGAAWHGGLRPGDAILTMGGVPVHDARTVLRSVAIAHPGTVFVFNIRRHGEIKTLSITLGKRPVFAEN